MLTIDANITAPRRQFGDMRARAEGRGLMTILARGLEEYERTMFATAGEGKWAPDDEETLAQKGGGRVLVDQGRLMRQLTHARILSNDVAEVSRGTAFYGDFLRDGERGMPKRDPAPMPDQRRLERWAEAVALYITTGETS